MGPCMAYNSISIKPYIKSHLELQREITLIELAPSPYFFCLKNLSCIQEVFHVYLNKFENAFIHLFLVIFGNNRFQWVSLISRNTQSSHNMSFSFIFWYGTISEDE